MWRKMDHLTVCYFATAIQVWGRLILGNIRNGERDHRWLTRGFSSVVIDHFYRSGQGIMVAGLYCDYLERKKQTTSNMLGAMLKQLVARGDIPENIRKAFEGAKEHFGGVGPDVSELLEMLKMAISQLRRVFICIDGLDESLSEHQTGLLRALKTIVQELPNIRLFLTGRPFIRNEAERYFRSLDTLSVSPKREDIELVLRIKLDEDTEPDAMDDGLKADIMELIPQTMSEMYAQAPDFPVLCRSQATY